MEVAMQPFDVNQRLPSEDVIKAAAEKAGVPFPAFKNLIYIESGGNPDAMSVADDKGRRAWGLGQLRGPAMEEMGLKWEDRLDPQKNADAAAGYFAKMLKHSNGDTALAGLMYFKGPGSDDAKLYQSGQVNNVSAEGKERISRMEGTAQNAQPSIAGNVPEQGTAPTTPQMPTSTSVSGVNKFYSEAAGNSNFNQEHVEAPTQRAYYKEQNGLDVGDSYNLIGSGLGKGIAREFIRGGGYNIVDRLGQGWGASQEFERQLMMMTGAVNRDTYLSPETIAKVEKELPYQNWGLTEGHTDAEVNQMLQTWKESSRMEGIFQKEGQLSKPAEFVGGMIGGIPTPQGLVATVATGSVGKIIGGAGRFVSRALTTAAEDGVVTGELLTSVHPVVAGVKRAISSAVLSGTEGATLGATFGAVNEASREKVGYYHTDEDLKDATISGAMMGALLGAGVGAYKARGAFAEEAVKARRTVTTAEATGEVTPTPEAVKPPSEVVPDVPKPTSTPVSEMSPEELKASASQLMERGDLKTWKSDIANTEKTVSDLKAQLAEVQSQKVKGSGKALAEGRAAKAEQMRQIQTELDYQLKRLEDARNSIKPHVEGGQFFEAARAISKQGQLMKMKSQVEKLIGEHDEMSKEHDFLNSTKGEKPRKGMTRRINNLKSKMDAHKEQIDNLNKEMDNIRGGKETVYTRHSEVSPQNRKNLKDYLGMSDENIDRITEGQAQDYLNRHRQNAEKGGKLLNKVTQSVDAVRQGVVDPSYSDVHEAGRDVHYDGKEVYTTREGEGDVGEFPETIPDVKMGEGTVVSGDSPVNPIARDVYNRQLERTNPVTTGSQKVGLLTQAKEAVFGNIFVNPRDISSVLHDADDLVEQKALAMDYAIPAKGITENGKHSMFRAGKATMEDISHEMDGHYNTMMTAVEKAERDYLKRYKNQGLDRESLQEQMGFEIMQAIEGDDSFYSNLDSALKPAVDAIREFHQKYYDRFNNLRQYNPDLTDAQIKEFKTSYEPKNYITRMVDAKKITRMNDIAMDKFNASHEEILHRQMVEGYDSNANIRKIWRETVSEEAKEAKDIVKKHQERIRRYERNVSDWADKFKKASDELTALRQDTNATAKAIKEAEKKFKSVEEKAKNANDTLTELKERLPEKEQNVQNIIARMDEDVLRKSYVEKAKEKAKQICNLDEKSVDVIEGNILQEELDRVHKLDHEKSTFQPFESNKIVKQRFPMDTAHELLLTDVNGDTYRYSYDRELRNTHLDENLGRYHRIAGSELANRAIRGQSYASEMLHLLHLKSLYSKIKDPSLRARALRSLEAAVNLQQVMRKNPRVVMKSAGQKIGKLMQNVAYYGANWSFGIQNMSETGLTMAHYLKSMAERDFPVIQDLGLGKNVKMSQKMIADLYSDLITGEMHHELAPRVSVISDSNRVAFGDNFVGRMAAKAEYASQNVLHGQWLNRFNEHATNTAYKYGQMVGLNVLTKDAVMGKVKGKYRGEAYLDSYNITPEEYEKTLQLIRDNVTVNNGEVNFTDRRALHTTREGYNIRKIMEMHGREGLQVNMPGQQTFGAAGPMMKMLTLFKDFARRSINKSIYFAQQGRYNQRKSQMLAAATMSYASEAMLFTLRTYLQSMSFPEEQREDFITSHLNLMNYGMLAQRTPFMGWTNAVTLPLGMIGLDPMQMMRQTAGFDTKQHNPFDSRTAFMNKFGQGLSSSMGGLSPVVSGAFALKDLASLPFDWSNYQERNKTLNSLQHNFRYLSMGNPLANIPANYIIDAGKL